MKDGEENRAFLTNLYLVNFQRLWGYAYCLTGDKNTADDIVHTVFLNIIKHAGTLKRINDDSKIKAYLNAAIRNACYNYAKKEAHCPVAIDFNELESISDGFLVDDYVITGVTVQAALERLTPLQRDLLTLYHYVGLRHKEISDITGLSIGNIGVSLFRARRAVRAYFEYG